jgi:acyl-CoA synthetase (AMP-forming)/AMP-acid ligase II
VTPPRPRAGRLSARLAEAAERARRLAARVPALARLAEQQRSAFGLPIPPYRVRIVDDEGRQVRASEVGELLVRGPGVTVGYDRDPEATGRATQEGWLHTGDLARRSALGLIAFVTRKKDVIKHGGFSVFPAEVEAQLAAHPAVAEAVVLGVPHPTKGAVPAAVVTLAGGHRATEAELLAWARENTAPFKAPRAVVVLPSSEIPRNANRKVLRDELCARVLPELEQRLAEASRTPGRPTGKRGRWPRRSRWPRRDAVGQGNREAGRRGAAALRRRGPELAAVAYRNSAPTARMTTCLTGRAGSKASGVPRPWPSA